MKIAVYPGSFDPITYGHIDLIKRLAHLYDQFYVLVSNTPRKSYLFTAKERAELVEKCVAKAPSLKVEVFSGLTVEFARKVNAQVIIRGLRAVSDFEYEFAMANMNKKLEPDIETLIVFTSPEYNFISSRMVKEVAHFEGDLKELVPLNVAEALKEKIKH